MEANVNTEPGIANGEFELRGIDHLALVCSDMKKTIAFYGGVLGMPLVEDSELPDGEGHQFVFDVGKGASLAFFWFGKEPKRASLVAAPGRHSRNNARRHHLAAAGRRMMCHLAFDVPAEKIDDYLERLQARGVPATIVNYGDSVRRNSDSLNEDTLGRSIYFTDPDGVVLEFATSSPAAAARVEIGRPGLEGPLPSPKEVAAGTGL